MSGPERATHVRYQQRAAIDRHDVMGEWRGEADIEYIVGAAPGVKDCASAAFAMRIDQFVDARVKASGRQRDGHEVTLPYAIALP